MKAEETQDGATTAAAPSIDHELLPPLLQDRSFLGMVTTQFLGAFNDNLFKQLMLLLALRVSTHDLQGLATVVFSLPFVLFSGFAGYLSDRHSKRTIVVIAKIAEIVVMLLGVAAFAAYGTSGFAGLLLVLFLMGTQSTFFGPGKYGILPEMLRARDLPRANGLMLMTTFLAIILGIASGGWLKTLLVPREEPLPLVVVNLWRACGACVVIAVLGTLASLAIRRVRPAKPDLTFHRDCLWIPSEIRQLLKRDRPLWEALLASCMFWMIGGLLIQIVNALGSKQLVDSHGVVGLSDARTSMLTAITSLGIALGAVVAGRVSRGRVDARIVRVGAWGIVGGLLLLSLPGPGLGRHLLGFWGSLPALVLLGAFAGMFAIPVQVSIQSRPPAGQKGRMIAVMNQLNFIAILLSGVIYTVFVEIVNALGWPRSPMFAFSALLMLPVAIFYRPGDESLIE